MKHTFLLLIQLTASLAAFAQQTTITYRMVGLINYLQTAGNTNAVFVQTSAKGYRKQPKPRNPHSWSIADPKATVAWLLSY